MKSFKVIFFLLALTVATVATAQKTVTILGKVTGDTKGNNWVYYYWRGMPKDSVAIENGEFKISLSFNETFYPLFFTQYEYNSNAMHAYMPFPLLIDEPGTIKIEMDIAKGFYSSKVTGAKTTEIYHEFLSRMDETTKKHNRLKAIRDSLYKVEMGKVLTNYVLSNKNNIVAATILYSRGIAWLSVSELEKTFNQLPENVKKTADGEKIAAYISGVKSSKDGSITKNFVLNDENGVPVSLADYKGKYVWIDFWASWCGPCKQAFPRMRELYAEYKNKNLEIIGISTDAKKEPWLKALETIKNPWKQVWDDKNVMSDFAVNAFPTSFLIGPDGKILVKEVGFNPSQKGEIVKKLEELLGPSKINFAKPAVK